MSHHAFTQTQPPPPSGGNQTENFWFHGQRLDFNESRGELRALQRPGQRDRCRSTAGRIWTRATPAYFDNLEMLTLNLSGGSFSPMPGCRYARVRRQPRSGRTSVRTDSNGNYHISSFFDIFTEISLDNGNTWTPSTTGPGTMAPGCDQLNLSSAINLNCSTNITVQATSSSGAPVFYTVTATGSCSPTVNANPPSGSTFPLGTSTVFVTASDACGNSALCSFTITVTAPPISLDCPSNITTVTAIRARAGAFMCIFNTASATRRLQPAANGERLSVQRQPLLGGYDHW